MADASAATEAAPASPTSLTGSARVTSGPVAAAVLGAAWLAWFGVLQWSVVRFRVSIVLTLTVCAALLAWWLARRLVLTVPRWLAPAVVVASVAITLTVPLFTYLRGGWLTASLVVLTVGGLGCAVLLTRPGHRAAVAAYALAVLTHTVLAVVAIVGDKAPRIDVWVVLQQGADALARGDNVYTQQWSDSPGVQDFFPYLPWMGVLTAPGRWLAGDVRWAVLLWSLVLFAGLWALARGRVERAAAVTAGARARARNADPGRPVVDRAGARRAHRLVGRAGAARQGLVGGHATGPGLCEQAAPGPARPGAARLAARSGRGARSRPVALAALLMLPWVVADAGAFLGDTVTTLLTFHPIKFANTWYLYALNEHGVTLPFWVTGAAMVGVVAVAAYAVWRRRPGIDELLRWLALVLAVANLVNKQAFYNQFWLVGALVAASLALPQGEPAEPLATARASTTGRPGSQEHFAGSGPYRTLIREVLLTSRRAVSRDSSPAGPAG